MKYFNHTANMLRSALYAMTVAAPLTVMGLATVACDSSTADNEEMVVCPTETRALISAPLRFANDVKLEAENLQAFIYNADGSYLIAPLSVTGLGTDSHGKNMLYMNIAPEDISKVASRQCRLLVLANWAETDGKLTSLSDQTFEIGADIPLFGCVEITLPDEGEFAIEGPEVYMLRSVAKLTVKLGQELIDMGITIGSAKINKDANLQGYCLPGTGTSLTLDPAWTKNHEAVFRPYIRKVGPVVFPGTNATELTVVMPELRNDGSYQIELQFLSDGKPFTGAFSNLLPISNRATQQPINLVRSHHYTYTIQALNTDVPLDPNHVELLDVIVDPWVNVEVPTIVFK